MGIRFDHVSRRAHKNCASGSGVPLGSTFEPLCHIIRLTLSIGAARRDGRPDKGKGERKGGKRQNQN